MNKSNWLDSEIHYQEKANSLVKDYTTTTIRKAFEDIAQNTEDIDNHPINLYREAYGYWDMDRDNLELKGKKDELKRSLPGVCFSGKFDGARCKSNFIQDSCTHTFVVDIDNLAISDVAPLKETLAKDKHSLFCFISPSENGLKIGIHVPTFNNDDDIKIIFEHVAGYMLDKYQIEIDKKCKDVSRLCFLSLDENVYINENAQKMDIDLSPKAESQSFDKKFEVAPARNNIVQIPSNTNKEKYISAAIASEIEILTAATDGGRNDQLNKSSFAIFGLLYVNNFEHLYDSCHSQLLSAAKSIGLSETEALSTINSAYKTRHTTSKQPYESIQSNNVIAISGSLEPDIAEKSIKDILLKNEPEDTGNPAIIIRKGYDSVITNACQVILNDKEVFFYNNLGICKIKTNTDKIVSLLNCSPEYVSHQLGLMINWKVYGAKGILNDSNSPALLLKNLSKLGDYDYLRELEGIVRQPIIDSEGNLTTETGYNKKHKAWLEFDIDKFDIKDKPTKQDAMDALKKLKALLSECHFKDSYDESAALCAILAGVTRSSLSTAPMILVNAFTSGTGKSYLCDMIMAFNTPNTVIPTPFPGSSEEFTKTIVPLLSESTGCINFDNLTTGIRPHKDLCSYLTNGGLKSRVLGSSKMQSSNSRELLISSGNNVNAVKDMKRRTHVISLDAGFENSVTRQFKSDPIKEIKDNREKYLSLVYTIIVAYLKSGDKVKAQPIASFGEWSKMCRLPLIWLGEEEPATRMLDSVYDSSDDESLGELLSAWYLLYGTSPRAVKMAIPIPNVVMNSQHGKNLFEHMLAITKIMLLNNNLRDIDAKAVGKYLSQNEGVPASGFMIKRKPKSAKSKKSVQWLIEVDPNYSEETEEDEDFEDFDL